MIYECIDYECIRTSPIEHLAFTIVIHLIDFRRTKQKIFLFLIIIIIIIIVIVMKVIMK